MERRGAGAEQKGEIMGGILATCVTPHPPLLIPEIGGRELRKVESTSSAMMRLAELVGELSPEVLVIVSPHSPFYADGFAVKLGDVLQGNFGQFGCARVGASKQVDGDLAAALLGLAQEEGLPLAGVQHERGAWSSETDVLDHGLLVPLYFLDSKFDCPIVSLSISGLSYRLHASLGRLVAQACEQTGRRAVFVASGDLSHRLIPGAPAGYSPRGEDFDRRIVEIARTGKFEELTDLPGELVAEAGECGLRSLHMMGGVLGGLACENQMLSYEGPFGVGYMVSFHRLMEEQG